MSLVGNILWIFLGGGIFLFIEYALGGILLCVTLIGLPFGYQLLRLALLAIAPFGREIIRGEKNTGCLATLLNLVWILTGGVIIVITHFLFALLCAITIIGLPFARQHLKLASFAIVPFGTTFR